MENGILKRVSESFLVHAPTFGGAEEEIYTHLGSIIRGEFIVEAITKTSFEDIFVHGDSPFEGWFEVNVKHTITDDNGKDKKVTYKFLSKAENAKDAYSRVMEIVKPITFDPEISMVRESKIMEVFEASEKSIEVV
jgi:hypothetical protein